MLLAFVAPRGRENSQPELCIIPRQCGEYSPPFPVAAIQPESAAVYYIGPSEGLMARYGDEQNSIIVEPIPPAIMNLTPDGTDQPGYRTARVKIVHTATGYRTYHMRAGDTTWTVWEANKQRKGAPVPKDTGE